jgi:peroxiredoxin
MFRSSQIVLTFAIWCGLAVIPCARGQEPATGSTTQPATQPTVTPAAQALLDQVRDAYGKLKSLDLAGTVAMDFDVARQTKAHSASFHGSFQSPRQFHHDMSGDVIISVSGDKLVTYSAQRNRYTRVDAPAERGGRLPREVREILREQNPSLQLALSSDAASTLVAGAQRVERIDDVTTDGVAYRSLMLVQDDRDVRVLFDPKTHLIRQVQFDLKRMLQEREVPLINKALLTIDYTKNAPDAAIDAARFAWTPPHGAMEVKVAGGAGGGRDFLIEPDDGPAQKLVGKPAPAFTLKDPGGTSVSLEKLKGNVVVLDFWATWCGPCREGLPHLDRTYKKLQDRPLRVFAINLREDKTAAQTFFSEQGLSIPILLDSDGAVADQYLVQGIPQTVVIDADGLVAQVFVGFGPGSAERLAEAIEDALK